MWYLAPVLILILAGAAFAPASAQPFRARQGVQSGEVRSLDEIVSGIRRERPGSLADVQGPSVGPAGDPRYRLKWVTPDGRVLWLDTDARTGRVLGVEGDDRRPPPGPPPPGASGFAPRRGLFPRPQSVAPPGDPPPAFGRGRPSRFEAPPPGFGRRSGGFGEAPPPGFDLGPPPGFRESPPPGFGRVGPAGREGPGGRYGRFRDR